MYKSITHIDAIFKWTRFLLVKVAILCDQLKTRCEICMGKPFVLTWNLQLCGFLLKLLNFVHENSPNGSNFWLHSKAINIRFWSVYHLKPLHPLEDSHEVLLLGFHCAFSLFQSLTSPSHHILSLHGKEKREHSSKILFLCSNYKRKSKGFGKILCWENDDRIGIFKSTTHNRLLSHGFSVQEGSFSDT